MKLLQNRKIAVSTAIFCTMMWGTAFPLIKLGYLRFGVEQGDIGTKLVFAGARFALAGILVMMFGALYNRKIPKVGRSELLPVALLGFLQTFLQYFLSYIGVGLTTAANTSVLTGTASLFSVLLAAMFFKSDRLTPLKALGCAVGLAGIALVNVNDFSLSEAYFAGDILVLGSALAGAGGNIITKRIMAGKNAVSVTSWQLFLGGIMLLVCGLLLGGRLDFTNVGGVIILLWLSLVSAVSFLLWTALLGKHPVSMISIFTMLVPVFGSVLSWIFLGEAAFGAINLISLALIAAGIVFVNLRGKDNGN